MSKGELSQLASVIPVFLRISHQHIHLALPSNFMYIYISFFILLETNVDHGFFTRDQQVQNAIHDEIRSSLTSLSNTPVQNLP